MGETYVERDKYLNLKTLSGSHLLNSFLFFSNLLKAMIKHELTGRKHKMVAQVMQDANNSLHLLRKGCKIF